MSHIYHQHRTVHGNQDKQKLFKNQIAPANRANQPVLTITGQGILMHRGNNQGANSQEDRGGKKIGNPHKSRRAPKIPLHQRNEGIYGMRNSDNEHQGPQQRPVLFNLKMRQITIPPSRDALPARVL